MDNIKINVIFPKATEIKRDLDNVLKSVGKESSIKLDLDISDFSKSIGEISQNLAKLKAQIGGIKGLENIIEVASVNASTKAIERQTEAIKNQQKTMENVVKTSNTKMVDSNGNEKIIKDLETIRDEYGNLIQVVNKYDAQTGELKNTFVTTTNEIEKQQKEAEKALKSIENLKSGLQNKLNSTLGNQNFNLIDDSVFTSLQAKINSINTNTPEKEINELKVALSNLNSSDSQIIRLQNAIEKNGIAISSLKDKYKDLVPENELKIAEDRINTLKNALQQIQANGGGYSNNGISSMLNDASSSMKSLTNATKNASEVQRLYNKEVVTFGGALKDVATKVGLFNLVYIGINKIQSAFREGVQSVIDMDTALSNLAKVVDLSESQLSSMRDSAVSMGQALGRSSIEIANAQAEFGRLYKDIDTINDLTEKAILGANVMDGISSEKVASGLTTIISSMELEAKDAITILDSLNEIQNNFKIQADELLNGLAEVGSVAKTSGVNLQELSGYITAIQIATGESGDSIGNSLNAIFSRVYKSYSENALDEIGVSVRDLEGNFRSVSDILVDLNGKWKTMNDTEKITLSQTVGGVNRYNELISLLNNFDVALDATEKAMDSMGSATKENEIYLNSIEGRMSSLKATAEGFWYGFINSDLIKGGISVLQTLANVLVGLQDAFGTTGLAVGSFATIFGMMSPSIKTLAQDIVKHKTTIGGLKDSYYKLEESILKTVLAMKTGQVSASGLKTGFQNLANSAVVAQLKVIALQTVLSMGLGLAIGAVTTLLTNLCTSLFDTEGRIQSVADASKNLSEAMENTTTNSADIDSYKELKKRLDDTTLSAEKRGEIERELEEVKKRLYSIDENSYAVLNNQNLEYEQQYEWLKKINEAKVTEQAQNLNDEMSKWSGFFGNDAEVQAERELKNLEGYITNYKKIKEMQVEAKGGDITYGTFGTMGFEDQNKALSDLELKIITASTKLQTYNSNVEMIKEANIETALSTLDLDDNTKSFIKTLLEATSVLQENTEAKEENSLAGNDEDAEAPTMKDLTKEYSTALNSLQDMHDMMETINKEAELTPDIVNSLVSIFPDIGGSLSDIASVQEFINNKLKEQQTIADQAFETMVSNDNNYYSNKLLKDESWMESFRQSLINMGMSQQDAYNLDLKKFDNLQQLKTYAMNTLGSGVEKWLNNYIDTSTSGYNIDFKNFKSFSEAKIAVLDALNQEVKKVTQNMQLAGKIADTASNMQSLYGTGNGVYSKLANDQLKQAQNNVKKYSDQLTGLNTAIKEVDYKLSGIGVGNITSGLVGGSPISATSSSGSGTSNKGSSSTEKETKDMDSLVDRYKNVETALSLVNNELTKNKTLMENSSDEKKLKLLDKEIQLLKKQKTALENVKKERLSELNELKKQLTNSGFTFNGDGTLKNYESRLNSLTNYANSITNNDKKESMIANVKAVSEAIDSYLSLLTDKIPEVTNDIDELKNTTIDTQKEIADILAKQKDDYIDNLEKETDALKKEIQKRKEIMNEQWAEEDYEDQLKEKQNNLLDLQAQLQDAMRMSDNELVKSIKNQIESAQQELNTFIRDNERDKANDRYDEELEQLDENLDSKIEEINNKLTDEQILVLVQNGVRDLSTVLSNIGNANKNIATTFSSVGDIINNNWIGSLDTFSSKLKAIQGIELSDLDANITTASSSKQKAIGDLKFEINLTVEGGNEDCIPKVKKLLKETKEEIYKEIGQIIK